MTAPVPSPQPPGLAVSGIATLARQVHRVSAGSSRTIIGIVGPPGSGKSTVVEELVRHLGHTAALVPMDGFHLSNPVLEALGRRDRKGAPDTFDAAGFVALLRRLRAPEADPVYAPMFRRDLEEPIAGAVEIDPQIPIVITEGNYLLLDTHPWHQIRGRLDATWYLQVDDSVRLERLVARHIAFAKTPDAARAWAESSDRRNADLVAASAGHADLVLRL